MLATVLLALGATTRSAETPALKAAYKDHFRVGTAVNRVIVTGTSLRRSPEQVGKDIALVKEQFNVVNEAISEGGTNMLRNSLWLEIIGPDFIAKAFQYAHEADPDAILRYNDYGLENPAKRRKLIALIKSLQEQHVPVMAIGSQTHVSVSSRVLRLKTRALIELETLGLPSHHRTRREQRARRPAQLKRGHRQQPRDHAGRLGGGRQPAAGRRVCGSFSGVRKAQAFRENGYVLGCK